MPRKFYRRRKIVRKRYGGKRAWYNKKYSAMSLGALALRKIWKLKGLINSEMHKHDVSFAATDMTITGSMTHLSNIAVGDSYATRTGNSCYLRAIHVNGTLFYNTTGGSSQQCRVIILQDTQQIGDNSPNTNDVLDTITSTNPFTAHLNPLTVGRFKILRDYRVIMDGVRTSSARCELNIPMRHHIRYNGVNGTDIQKGGIYILLCSNKATSNFPLFYGDIRLSFHDN